MSLSEMQGTSVILVACFHSHIKYFHNIYKTKLINLEGFANKGLQL